MRSRIFRKKIVWVVVIAFFTWVTPAFSGTRIIPTGSVKVYKGDKLVQVLKKEAALPNGALLATEGRCGVRSENLYLAADDGSTFSITVVLNCKILRVDNGVVYFAINQKSDKLVFITPAGDISTVQVRSNANINGDIIKGYLDVNKKIVQLGVLEGGSLVVATSSGVQEIRAGNQISLAMADPINEEDKSQEGASAEGQEATSVKEKANTEGTEAVAEEATAAAGEGIGGAIPAAFYVGGSILAGAAIVGIIANQTEGGGGEPGPASRVAP